jgi:hypothetical protein
MVRETDIGERLARIETKLDAVLTSDTDKEKRLRSLERWKWSHALSGGALAIVLAKFGIPMPGAH